MNKNRQRASYLSTAFITFIGIFSRMKPVMWRWFYNRLAREDKNNQLLLMNYGFSDPATTPAVLDNTLDTEQELYRYPIQLYQHVVNSVNIQNKNIAEVGCGRGGGAAYIARHYQPAMLTAIDLSNKAIEWCKQYHHADNLSFAQGSADKLPLSNSNIDAVINIESSHCYPSLGDFISEVGRVLKPNGYLLTCDMRTQAKLDLFRKHIEDTGLKIIHEQNITPQVLTALDAMSEDRSQSIGKTVPRLFRKTIRDFVAIQGTPIYDMLQDGRLMYYSHVCQMSDS